MNPPPNRALIAPTSNPRLERALLEKLMRRAERVGSLGELEPLAVRIGLMQNSLKPRFRQPHLLVAAADHGLAVEGLPAVGRQPTHALAQQLLQGRMPLNVLARLQQIRVTVVDAGIAESMPASEGLLQRKIAHGTRNARLNAAMTTDQAHAAIRAGMEIGDNLPGNVVMCAGIGVGSRESAALVLSRLTDTPVRDLLISGPHMDSEHFARLMGIAQAAQMRHREVSDPVEVLAAFGGFEMAVLAGVMLVAAGRRHLLMIDGMPALAALMVASRLAPPVTDYSVFCRSHQHLGLDHALALFRASALLELGMESTDGTGSALAWSLVNSAAALLTDVPEGEEPGPTLPQDLDETP
ncbi:MAG: nicotinate-nucleotide--dimethylbenzimidazole phosphoribosyltransferase [Rubrivivax sp.]|nr:nicotinate-nucleotide--dimethylbenzimidazole phosphoribosyltransferase [Rubrivivax sp.]